MTFAIRARMITAMNLLALTLGMAVGWVGVQVTGDLIEARLVDDSARNAGSLITEMRLPLPDSLLRRFGQVLGAEVAADAAKHEHL